MSKFGFRMAALSAGIFAVQNGMGAEPAPVWKTLVSDQPQVQTTCGGVPVMRFGDCFVLGQSPTFLPDAPLQAGNHSPRRKIAIRTSFSLTNNYIGLCTTRSPHTTDWAERPLEPANLIDGDLATCWMSRQQTRAAEQPIWIRIDLPLEQTVAKLILKKRPLTPRPRMAIGWHPTKDAVEVGRGLPKKLSVKISCTGAEWATVFDGATLDEPAKESWTLTLPAHTRAKQIWISSEELVMVENMLYSFSLAEVQVLNPAGKNVALLTAGAGVTVNSTYHTMGNQDLAERRWYWPLHYDCGAKWIRVGYHDDPYNWHWVERERNVLKMDPVADAAITELISNRVNVIMALNYGNRIYSGPDRRECPQLFEWNYDLPKPPTTSLALDAWTRYVAFMANRFGDRVHTFEIWNEWNIPCYWGDQPDLSNYLAVVEAAIPAIRVSAPKAKIMMGSISGFPYGISQWDADTLLFKAKTDLTLQAFQALATKVDVIGIHPCYNRPPEEMHRYAEDLKAFKTWLASVGFKGQCMVSEWNYGALYPFVNKKDIDNVWCGPFNATELTKAKLVARMNTCHAGLDMVSCFCELYSSDALGVDLSLMRDGFHQDPISPVQPQAAYYVTRNLATLMEGWTAQPFPVEIAAQSAGWRYFTFQKSASERGLAVWFDSAPRDAAVAEPVTLTLKGEANGAVAYDPINGVSQELNLTVKNGQTTIAGLMVSDSPVFVKLTTPIVIRPFTY